MICPWCQQEVAAQPYSYWARPMPHESEPGRQCQGPAIALQGGQAQTERRVIRRRRGPR